MPPIRNVFLDPKQLAFVVVLGAIMAGALFSGLAAAQAPSSPPADQVRGMRR